VNLTIIRHTDRVWRYHWRLTDGVKYVANNYSITVWGARWAARKAIKKSHRPKPKNVGETVFEEEL